MVLDREASLAARTSVIRTSVDLTDGDKLRRGKVQLSDLQADLIKGQTAVTITEVKINLPKEKQRQEELNGELRIQSVRGEMNKKWQAQAKQKLQAGQAGSFDVTLLGALLLDSSHNLLQPDEEHATTRELVKALVDCRNAEFAHQNAFVTDRETVENTRRHILKFVREALPEKVELVTCEMDNISAEGVYNDEQLVALFHRWQNRSGVNKLPLLPAAGVIPRPDLQDELKELLFGGSNAGVSLTSSSSAVPSAGALRGLGGVGKSALACAAVHDSAVQGHFEGGIAWITLGESPDVKQHQRALFRLFYTLAATGDARDPLRERALDEDATVADLRDCLSKIMSGVKGLLVLDDAWKSEHVDAFLFPWADGRLLVTTRFQRIAAAPSLGEISVDIPDLATSKRILAAYSECNVNELRGDEDTAVLELVESVCRRLPLALAITGSLKLNTEESWSQLLARHREDGDRWKLNWSDQADQNRNSVDHHSEYKGLGACLQASLTHLQERNEATLDQYLRFAVFAEDTWVPLAVICRLWQTKRSETDARLRQLARASLVEIEHDEVEGTVDAFVMTSSRIKLHDLLRDYINHLASPAELGRWHMDVIGRVPAAVSQDWYDGYVPYDEFTDSPTELRGKFPAACVVLNDVSAGSNCCATVKTAYRAEDQSQLTLAVGDTVVVTGSADLIFFSMREDQKYLDEEEQLASEQFIIYCTNELHHHLAEIQRHHANPKPLHVMTAERMAGSLDLSGWRDRQRFHNGRRGRQQSWFSCNRPNSLHEDSLHEGHFYCGISGTVEDHFQTIVCSDEGGIYEESRIDGIEDESEYRTVFPASWTRHPNVSNVRTHWSADERYGCATNNTLDENLAGFQRTISSSLEGQAPLRSLNLSN
eukprot:COSAG04_NODE_2647_length_3802_cov_37.368080_2_plen_883_part_01